MNTHDLNFKRRAFYWWDKLTMTQKVWYGQMYPELQHKTDLVYHAYNDYIENKGHLKVLE